MKNALLLALLVGFSALLHAQPAPLLRQTYLQCHELRCLPIEEYAAWSQLFLDVEDEEAAEACAAGLFIYPFLNQCLARQTVDTLSHTFPSTDFLNNALAWTLYLSERDCSDAYTFIRKVKHLDNASRDTYAVILLRMGHPAEALQQILEVLIENRNTPVTNENVVDKINRSMVLFDHAGDIFYKNGLYDEALLAWKEAYKIAVFLLDHVDSEHEFLAFNYDLSKTKQKLRALYKKLDAINDATTP